MTLSKTVGNPDADLLAPITGCDAVWGRLQCPNEVTHVIINNQAAGFCPVCQPHKDAFSAPEGLVTIVNLTEFNRLKEKGLYMIFDTIGEMPDDDEGAEYAQPLS